MIRSIAALAIVAGLTTPTFAAGDAGLYAAPPPPDAAYVRILNADISNAANVTLGSVIFSVPASGLSAYSFVTKGDYQAALPGGTLPVSFVAQKFYTLVLDPGAGATPGTLIEDAPVANPVHAGLYFYNVSGTPLGLSAKVGGKQAAVFTDIAPANSASREVNAFEVAFLVTGGKSDVELPPVVMARQQGVSIVALDSGDGISAFLAVNAVSTP
jgi:alginate O-acetyltransferase complex protein AlgF